MTLQTNTMNKSFLDLHDKMDNFDVDMDVNSPLLLLDKKLQNDEYKDIREKRQAIHLECRHNIWYYFREFVRLCTKQQFIYHIYHNVFPFTITDKLYKVIWCYNMGYNFIIDDDTDSESIYETLFLLLMHYRFFIRSNVYVSSLFESGDYSAYYISSQLELMQDYIESSMDINTHLSIIGEKNEKTRSNITKGHYLTGALHNLIYDQHNINFEGTEFELIVNADSLSDILKHTKLNDKNSFFGSYIEKKKNEDEEDPRTDIEQWVIDNIFINIQNCNDFSFTKTYATNTPGEQIAREKIFYI